MVTAFFSIVVLAGMANTNALTDTLYLGDPVSGSNVFVALPSPRSNGSQRVRSASLADLKPIRYPKGLSLRVVNALTNQSLTSATAAPRVRDVRTTVVERVFINPGLLLAMGESPDLRIKSGGALSALCNVGTIALSNETFSAAMVTNATAGVIRGRGTFNSPLVNAGLVTNQTGGTLTFSAPVLNQSGGIIVAREASAIVFENAVSNEAGGLIAARRQSLLEFKGGFFNAGTLALNPSTSVFTGPLTLGPNGALVGPMSNDVFIMRGDFISESTNNMGYDTRYAAILFGGVAGTGSNTFEVAGTNKFATFDGFANNFAVGTLNITNHTVLTNAQVNIGGLGTNEALYVDVLHLFTNATLKLSDLTIYVGDRFVDENTGMTYQGTGVFDKDNHPAGMDAYIFFDAYGAIVFIPEPSVATLIAAGLAVLFGGRRRTGRLREPRRIEAVPHQSEGG